MRIAFAGPGGSGKTTLAERLGAKLGLRIIGSSTRGMMQQLGIKDLSTLDRDRRAILQYRALAAHMMDEIWCQVEGFVADRTVWDFLVYFEAMFGDNPEMVTGYKSLPWKMGLGEYDVVFYVAPHGKPVEPDGVRYSGEMKWVEDFVHSRLQDVVLDKFKTGKIKRYCYLAPGDDREATIDRVLKS